MDCDNWFLEQFFSIFSQKFNLNFEVLFIADFQDNFISLVYFANKNT